VSYMRWPIYAWVGGDEHHPQMHLWARRDARDEGVLDPVRYTRDGADAFPDFVSGVAMPLDLFDELVVMRYAELVAEDRVAETVERVRAKGCGNVGTRQLGQLIGDDPVDSLKVDLEQ
jgi:hypothetical protein